MISEQARARRLLQGCGTCWQHATGGAVRWTLSPRGAEAADGGLGGRSRGVGGATRDKSSSTLRAAMRATLCSTLRRQCLSRSTGFVDSAKATPTGKLCASASVASRTRRSSRQRGRAPPARNAPRQPSASKLSATSCGQSTSTTPKVPTLVTRPKTRCASAVENMRQSSTAAPPTAVHRRTTSEMRLERCTELNLPCKGRASVPPR